MGRRKKKKKNKKKRKERYTVKKEGGRGRREREGTVKPSAKFPFYRRDAKVSTTIASFTWWQWKKKRIRFEYDNFSLSLPFFSSSYDVSKE